MGRHRRYHGIGGGNGMKKNESGKAYGFCRWSFGKEVCMIEDSKIEGNKLGGPQNVNAESFTENVPQGWPINTKAKKQKRARRFGNKARN